MYQLQLVVYGRASKRCVFSGYLCVAGEGTGELRDVDTLTGVAVDSGIAECLQTARV